MNETLRLSPAGLRLIQAFESCRHPIGGGRFRAYFCPAGKLTIGWGHTNDHGRKFDALSVWTQAECDAALREDIAHFEAVVRRRVTVPLRQHQFDALVSFTFNCGEANFARSTLLRKINMGDFAGAARQFPRWNRGGGRVLPGLVRRRTSEALLFQGIPDRNYDGKPDPLPMPQRVDPPPKP